MLEKLKNDLLGMELNFIELDNKMESYGFYTVFNDGNIDDIKEVLTVVYLLKREIPIMIMIGFNIIINNSIDESKWNFILKVNEIEYI